MRSLAFVRVSSVFCVELVSQAIQLRQRKKQTKKMTKVGLAVEKWCIQSIEVSVDK